MKHQLESSIDRISDLPSNITDTILTFLPLRDIMRTSILSRDWEFKWVTVPQLVFEDNVYLYERRSPEERDIYNVNVIYEYLVQHQGPLRKFSLGMTGWQIRSDIDRIIPQLSTKGISDLALLTRDKEYPELPSSIFSCVELRHLSLTGCVFHPLSLERFNKLVSAELLHITLGPRVSITCGPVLESLKLVTDSKIEYLSIDAPNLKSFFFKGCVFKGGYICAPLLKSISLSGDGLFSYNLVVTLEDFELEDFELDLISLFGSLPPFENLHLSSQFRKNVFHKLMAKRDSPNELSVVLKNLRTLELTELNLVAGEHPTTLWLMRNVPNLRKLKIELWQEVEDEEFEVKHIADYSLLNLQEVEVRLECDWSKPKFNIAFIEFLLAISPVLETLYIKTPVNYISVSSYKVLSELVSFRRASPAAKIIFLGPDWN